MPVHPRGFKCRQCSACCRAYVQVTDRDLLRWATQFRQDILEHVSEEGFIEPVEALDGPSCPFLKRLPRTHEGQKVYACTIHDTKPKACVRFPACREEAERVGCRAMG